MKTFTKDMLVPGKHVVELRNGQRYLVLQSQTHLYFTNSKESYSSLVGFDEEMKYKNPSGCRLEMEDVMKVFLITRSMPMGELIFEDMNLTEVWHREEIFIRSDEKEILRNIHGFCYIARDPNGDLYAYKTKPIKLKSGNYGGVWCDLTVFNRIFQMVKCTDDEPWKIGDLLNLPEKERD